MRELRCQSRFAPERAHGFVVSCDRRMQRLERNLALERKIARAPYRSEGAGTECRENLVIVTDSPAHARLGGVAAAWIGLAANHRYRPRGIASLDRAQQHRHRLKSVGGIGRVGPIGGGCERLRLRLASQLELRRAPWLV